jgi:capsular exopolysaccharide synthesis family protein
VVQAPDSAEADSVSLHPKPEDRLVALGDQRSLGAEKFRVLASRVRQAQKQLGFRRLLITSSTIGDGKSMVSSNLGLSMAQYAGYRVLMIDTDSRRGQLSALMNCKSAPGLQEWLLQGGPPTRYLRRYSETLWFMPSGAHPGNQQQQFDVDYVSRALATTSEPFDLVIVDSPPVTMLADATIWLGVTDMCLLVVRRAQTPKRLFEKALAAVEPAKMLGVVFNEYSDSTHSYYAQYYGTTVNK